jgi:hypothetical protein
MDNFCIGSEGADLPGDPVVEARAEGDEEIGFLHGHYGRVIAVHPRHPEALAVAVGERPPGHEGRNHRCVGELGQLAERFYRPRL